MTLFLLIAALLIQAPAPRGAVTGTVVIAGTTAPIVDAEIAIVTPDGLVETTTDANGRFTLTNIPAGRQTVLIRADGYFVESVPRAEVPVTVTAGTAPVVVPSVSMVRGGTVSGRVVDPQGSPLPLARVQALRPGGETLNSGAVPDFGNRMTDDRGEYRMFFVPPGEYVIRAQAQGGPTGTISTRPGEVQRLVSTLYPSATDVAQAGKVLVKSGEEIRGIDISVKMEVVTLPPPAPRPTGGVKISGLVFDRADPWVGTAALLLGSEAQPGAPRTVGTVIVGGTPGAFEITNVQPGNYDLFASLGAPNGSPGPGGGGVQAWGRTTVEVRDKDVADIRLTIRPSVDVSGVVKIDGKLATEGTFKVGLSPTGTAGRIGNYRGILDRTQTPDATGQVKIPLAAEGNYQVFVQGAGNLYITDVRQGDASVLVKGIDVRNATAAPFEVLLSSDGGTVEGVVSNRDKSAMGGATVVLVPADKQLLQARTATAGADGKYTFSGVRPGDYSIFATPAPLPPGSLPPDGTRVTVKAGISAKVDISN
jgi:protocatechuate 3,4-dioxygenase beta subunit